MLKLKLDENVLESMADFPHNTSHALLDENVVLESVTFDLDIALFSHTEEEER